MKVNPLPLLEELPLEERARILAIRLDRAERALLETETALESRMRELDSANKELSRRESELAERLNIESRQLLAALSTANMATIYGEKDRPFSASGEAAQLLGLAPGSELTPDLLIKAIHPLDQERIVRSATEFFTKMTPAEDHVFEHRIKRYDTGATHWLSWVIRRESVQKDRPAATYGTVRDITLSRANERGIKALQLRAERRVEELDRLSGQLTSEKEKTAMALAVRTKFLTEMAHQIRTPLGSLTGGLELLSDQLDPKNADFAVVKEASDRLVEIASQLIKQADIPADDSEILATHEVLEPKGFTESEKTLAQAPKVLLAEDTESNRYVIERMLTGFGCEATVVTNGVEAVESAKKNKFDLILMDVMMPLMDGEQATKVIRDLSGPVSKTPIIGVTAHSLQAERERLLAAGMNTVLTKPLRRETLESAITSAVLAGNSAPSNSAKFDHEVFQRVFFDLPAAYRDRMCAAAKKDISDYGAAVLDAAVSNDNEAISKASHSLKGVALNVGAIGIVEQLSLFRENRDNGSAASTTALRSEIASCLLAFDDLFEALVGSDQ
ncbi:MAG: response regulator [Marinomonas sp.]